MNPIQIEQMVPQAQVQDFSRSKPVENSGSSFAETLRAAKESERTENQNPVSKSEKTESSETLAQETKNNSNDEKVASANKNQKTQNTNQEENDSANNNESELIAESEVDSVALAQNVAVLQSGSDEVVLAQTDSAELAADLISEVQEQVSDKDVLMNEKSLAWLRSVEKNDSNPELDEKIETLLKKGQLNPEVLTDDKDLRYAQDVSMENPEEFLQNVQTAFAAEIGEKSVADGDSKQVAMGKKGSDSEIKVEKKSGAQVSVHDLRTAKRSGVELSADKAVSRSASVSKEELKIAYNQETEQSVQMTMDLMHTAEQNITSSSQQSAGANGSTFQQMLANTVQNNAPEFVKAGNIILKDNNQGSINLVLRPESLGNVKISLSLSDKLVSGQITVMSREAYEAFKDNIDSIKQAFAQSGYETGSFDLNFSQGDSQQGFAQNDGGNDFNKSFHAERTYGELAVAESDSSVDYEVSSTSGINIVA